ncbi:hypothetical protein GGR51DRAFT_515009 [Nemania sp. FL0031]|nr:hypothetical protein GGR51DRAFT_515009 [Nemania sp. FL0031]
MVSGRERLGSCIGFFLICFVSMLTTPLPTSFAFRQLVYTQPNDTTPSIKPIESISRVYQRAAKLASLASSRIGYQITHFFIIATIRSYYSINTIIRILFI